MVQFDFDNADMGRIRSRAKSLRSGVNARKAGPRERAGRRWEGFRNRVARLARPVRPRARDRAIPSGIELAVPVQVIDPGLVEEARSVSPADLVEFVDGRDAGRTGERHPGLPERLVALARVAAAAGGDDVLPRGPAAVAAGDHVVEGQLLGREALTAVLAPEIVPQEHVEAREGRLPVERLELFQRDHAGYAHLEGWAADGAVVRFDECHAILEDGVDGVLPGPDRQREVAEGPEIRVEDQRVVLPERHRFLSGRHLGHCM